MLSRTSAPPRGLQLQDHKNTNCGGGSHSYCTHLCDAGGGRDGGGVGGAVGGAANKVDVEFSFRQYKSQITQ